MVTGPPDPNTGAIQLTPIPAAALPPGTTQSQIFGRIQVQPLCTKKLLSLTAQRVKLMERARKPFLQGHVSNMFTVINSFQVALYYDPLECQLMVTVVEAFDLAPRIDGTSRNPYIKMFLLPDRRFAPHLTSTEIFYCNLWCRKAAAGDF